MTDPKWLQVARMDLGLREISGPATAPKISAWLAKLGAWWRDDETPWCGVAVAAWMSAAGVAYPKAYFRAKAWADWGVPCQRRAGAVAVFGRDGGGHVGLIVGQDQRGRLMVIGGNQGNAVTIAPFDPARLIACRWPSGVPLPDAGLSVISSTAASSENEA